MTFAPLPTGATLTLMPFGWATVVLSPIGYMAVFGEAQSKSASFVDIDGSTTQNFFGSGDTGRAYSEASDTVVGGNQELVDVRHFARNSQTAPSTHAMFRHLRPNVQLSPELEP